MELCAIIAVKDEWCISQFMLKVNREFTKHNLGKREKWLNDSVYSKPIGY
jgi:hypothetical protein